MTAAVISFCMLCLLLLAGKILRIRFSFFQRLYLPSSVIGGLLGLIILSLWGERIPEDCHAGWSAIPSFLINIVFASLFLGVNTPNFKTIWKLAAPQFCYGQVVAWGQYIVGIALVLLLLGPVFGVSPAFGALIEVGFEGGHGTVAGLTQSFEELGWPQGVDIGFTVATVGMISGLVIGMGLINLAVDRNWVKNIRSFRDQSRYERFGIHPADRQPSAGKQTVSADSIDTLALHIALIGLAILIGFLIKLLLAYLNGIAPQWLVELKVLESFPLFPLCMIGGLVVQKFFVLAHIDYLIDHELMRRLSGTALDFLVVSAVAVIQLDFVLDYWLPLLFLCLGGILWNVFCILFLAPRIMPDAWFERGIAEFGQSAGVTATGLLLLRTVDPENKTVASEAFGYKQLLHEPIMGGGIWTSLAVPLLLTQGSWFVFCISICVVVGWLLFWRFCLYKK